MPMLLAFNDPKGCQADGNSAVQKPNSNQVTDVVTSSMSHEFSETITDPVDGTGWYDHGSGNEDGDNCSFTGSGGPTQSESPNAFLPTLGGSASAGTLYDQVIGVDHYYTQTEWSNGNLDCQAQPAASSFSVDFASSVPVDSGHAVSFSPSGTASAGFSSVTWDFGDGTATTFSSSAPATVTHTFASTGPHLVTETVVDANGQLTTATHTVTVATGSPGPSPTAAFTVTTSAPVSNDPVSFDGSGSSASSGSLSYSWNFGDGGTDTTSGATPSHSYASPGTYVVELTVSDGGTATANISHTITVAQPTPSAAFTIATASPRAGAPVSFDGSGSGERGGSIASYAWTFGDGSSGSGVAPSHSYSTPGSYLVALTVTDPNGQSASASHVVTVAAAPAPPPAPPPPPPPAPSPSKGSPSAAISVATSHPIAGATVTFSGSGSSDQGSTLVAYGWSFGDGGSATGVTPGHRYAHPGRYAVTLTVRDATGTTAATSRRVTVGSAAITGVKIKKGKTIERLTVALSGPGTLTLGKLKVKAKRAGAVVVKIRLNAAQRHRVTSHHSVVIRLTLRFAPKVGKASRRAVKFSV
jgi:PKD repeat protein